jgi:hypothetical protein
LWKVSGYEFNVASKSSGCLSKSKANGSISHPFIGFQDHGKICDSTLEFYVIAIASFDLWMSKFGHDA